MKAVPVDGVRLDVLAGVAQKDVARDATRHFPHSGQSSTRRWLMAARVARSCIRLLAERIFGRVVIFVFLDEWEDKLGVIADSIGTKYVLRTQSP